MIVPHNAHELSAGVLVFVAGYPPATQGGGPIRTLEAMVNARRSNTPLSIVTSAFDHLATKPLDGIPIGSWVSRDDAAVFYGDTRHSLGLLQTYRAARDRGHEVLYVNSFFSLSFGLLPVLLARMGFFRVRKICIAPRGEFDPGALRLKRRKKQVAIRFLRFSKLLKNVLWHASTPQEKENILALFPNARVAVKENETILEVVTSAHRRREGRTELLYLGRVSVKKRLHLLIQAISLLSDSFDLQLTVAGPGDADYMAECRELALPLGERVEFIGPVDRDQVLQLFREAHLACFPTAGENFGHVIAEALSQGCPVVIGDVTPWTPHIENGAGFLVRDHDSASGWATALRSAVHLLGERGPEWNEKVRQTFIEWSSTTDKGSFLDALETDSERT